MQDKAVERESDAVAMEVLEIRWMACYMLYDWCLGHALHALEQTELEMRRKIIERQQTEIIPIDAYNGMLAVEIENYIQTHISVWAGERHIVEVEIAKLMATILWGSQGKR